MVKKSLLLVYRVIFWLVSIVITILLLAALAIQFLIFPNIDQYKENIANFASKAAKQRVVIGKIKADWQGFNPHLLLSNIDIYDAQNRPALLLKNTDLSLSWLSIPLLELRLAGFTVRAPELTIRRDTSGDIFVAGISMQGPSKPDLPNWLLRQNKFEVLNAKVIWLDELRGAPALSLDNLNLQIVSPPWKSFLKNHRISLSALPSIGTDKPILLNANVYGNDISQLAEWSGSADAQVKNYDITAFKPWLNYAALTHPINVQSGIGSAEVKVQFAKRQIQSIKSNVALDNVHLLLKANTEPVILKRLAGEINWKNSNLDQSFSVNHLVLNTNNGLQLQDTTGSYIKSLDGNESLTIKLAHIDLAFIKPYLVQLPLPAEILQKIVSLSPTGKLDDLTLNWQGEKSITKTYQLNTKFNGLSVLAYEKIPGFDNLTGEVKANQNAGKITLNTLNAKLDFKALLRWPIPVEKLSGNISWNTNTSGTSIKASQLNISNPHLSGTINAAYLMDGNKGGHLDLTGKFGKGNAKYALFYYPKTLSETTLHWLDTSILAGRAEDINLTIKGRLADFPFVDSKNNLDKKLGLFRVSAKLSDSLIEYGTDWPTIDGFGVDLLFEGNRMELNANAGYISGNQIIKSKTTIAQLDADYPILKVVSELKGPVVNGLKFVNSSPVRDVTQGFTDDLKSSGLGKLNLSLIIPLQNIDASQYKGLYQISNGSIEAPSVPMLTRINGVLEFTESSLTAKNINASAFGAPVILGINSGKDKIIRIALKGKINDAAIKQVLVSQNAGTQNSSRLSTNNSTIGNLAKGANYFVGSTDWAGDITIQKPVVNIAIRSDLFGLSSRLPSPFNKSSNERINLRVEKNQALNNDTITINLGSRLAAKIMRTAENGKLKFDRGSVRINASSITPSASNNAALNNSEINTKLDLSKGKGLQVYGNMDYLDADAWRNVLHDFSGGTESQSTLPIQKLALKINTLDIYDRRINQLKITNNTEKDGLRATIQSREITGDLQWLNQDNGKLIARLKNLTVPDSSPNRIKVAEVESSAKEFSKLEQDYPALDIIADTFEFNKKNFGALELIAYPQSDNWNIQKLKLTSPDSVISAEGQWNNWYRNPNTYLNITWDIKNLGRTLKNVGYPDTIQGGEGVLSGQLQWPGSPHEFNSSGLNGNLQLDMKKGQILKVQPGVGRLLGLLSLQSLPRRLTLDFRDLFSNGFAFDKINATAKINQGVMTSDDFLMTGPAAEVKIKGETNLQKETQHLVVKVLPHVSDSLSLAALAGGPLAGAIAFLAQKILKDPLNKIASSEYEIVGTWDNPQEVKTSKNNEENNKPTPLN